MRMIGHLQSESGARTFSDYLYVQGIKNLIEAEKDGTWLVWVEGEDDLDQARGLLQRYLSQPDDQVYRRVAKQASELREREREQEEKAAKRFIDGGELLRQQGAFGMGPLTLTLIALSVITWSLIEFGGMQSLWHLLKISNYSHLFLPEIRSWQIWRLITPIFLHAPMPMFLHILFNMLWLKDLGSMVEARQSSLQLGLLVLIISAASNFGQYLVSGPNFCGMSGVVYGLLGYIWMKSRFDPASGYFLHSTTVAIMLIWFVFCLAGGLSAANMAAANTVHAVGLATGVAWGYLSSIRSSPKRR